MRIVAHKVVINLKYLLLLNMDFQSLQSDAYNRL